MGSANGVFGVKRLNRLVRVASTLTIRDVEGTESFDLSPVKGPGEVGGRRNKLMTVEWWLKGCG